MAAGAKAVDVLSAVTELWVGVGHGDVKAALCEPPSKSIVFEACKKMRIGLPVRFF
jgi:hypothetical protein